MFASNPHGFQFEQSSFSESPSLNNNPKCKASSCDQYKLNNCLKEIRRQGNSFSKCIEFPQLGIHLLFCYFNDTFTTRFRNRQAPPFDPLAFFAISLDRAVTSPSPAEQATSYRILKRIISLPVNLQLGHEGNCSTFTYPDISIQTVTTCHVFVYRASK